MSGPYSDVSRASIPRALEDMLVRNWWVVGLRGLVAVLFGLCAFFFTGATILSLVLLFSVFALLDGASAIMGAVSAARHHHHWFLLALQGVVSVLAAVIALVWPGLTAIAFVIVLAAWSIVSGALMLGLAFNAGRTQRWWMVLNGALSLAFGIVLALAPVVGAVVLTWWLGAFAIVFGISLMVLSFTLRSHLHETPGGTPAHA